MFNNKLCYFSLKKPIWNCNSFYHTNTFHFPQISLHISALPNHNYIILKVNLYLSRVLHGSNILKLQFADFFPTMYNLHINIMLCERIIQQFLLQILYIDVKYMLYYLFPRHCSKEKTIYT